MAASTYDDIAEWYDNWVLPQCPRSFVGVTRMGTEYSRAKLSGFIPMSWIAWRYLVT